MGGGGGSSWNIPGREDAEGMTCEEGRLVYLCNDRWNVNRLEAGPEALDPPPTVRAAEPGQKPEDGRFVILTSTVGWTALSLIREGLRLVYSVRNGGNFRRSCENISRVVRL